MLTMEIVANMLYKISLDKIK